MISSSGGEDAHDSMRGRDGDPGGGNLRAQTKDATPPADPSNKDYLVNDAIGKALQAHYRSLADAPLPDRLLILLAELEAKDSDDDR